MYFVNWQRNISLEEREGQKVVVKKNKSTTEFHEYILFGTYVMISILLAHPSPPPMPGGIARNEGHDMRRTLGQLGIQTPRLLFISNDVLVEEYIEGGDLYRALATGTAVPGLAGAAGALTGRMHRAGYVFTDNKAQNFLVRGGDVLRTDLGFIQKSGSVFARSMDVGSFLASIMDLSSYRELERAFYGGYKEHAGSKFPYLSLVIRNILSAGFASDSRTAIKNMMIAESSKLLGSG
jgi:tRNA A-37 threonylcarbamoyl transferase component Bud32